MGLQHLPRALHAEEKAARKLRSRGAKDDVAGGGVAPPPTASQAVHNLLAGTETAPINAHSVSSGITAGVLPPTTAAGAAGAFIMLGVEGMPPPLQVALPATDIMTDMKNIYRCVVCAGRA